VTGCEEAREGILGVGDEEAETSLGHACPDAPELCQAEEVEVCQGLSGGPGGIWGSPLALVVHLVQVVTLLLTSRSPG